MRLQTTAIALCLFSAVSACSAAQHESPDAASEHVPATAGVADSAAAVARSEPGELGEVVQQLGEKLWIVFQDKTNTYWFGSDGQGVYRVDAKEIVRYTTKDGLCNDHVRQILEDKSGNIYVNTTGGISKFDGRRFSTLVPSEASADEWELQPDDLWFKGTQDDNGPLRYDGQTLQRLAFPRHALEDKWRGLFPKAPYSPYITYIVCKDSRGSVWFGTSCFGVRRFDGNSFTWVSEDELIEFDNGPSLGVRGIVEDKDGKFWFSDTHYRYDVPPADSKAHARGAAQYNRERGLEQPSAGDEAAYSYFVSGVKARDDALWLATYGAGVWRYDGRNLTRYPVAEGDKTVLLFSIYEDHAGVLWLGSTESGVYRFNGKSFERFRP